MSMLSSNQVSKAHLRYRANLENAREKSEYERGYQVLLDFFGEHL